VLFICVFLTASTLLSIFLVPRFVKDRPVAASMAQGMSRYAAVVQAIPLLTIMYGAGNMKTATVMLPFAVLLDAVLAVLVFLCLTPRHKEGEHPLKTSLVTIFRTPIILASILGIVFILAGWKLPSPLKNAVSSVGSTASPLAMIMLGAQFRPSELRRGLRYSLPTAAVHLLLYPVAAIGVAVLLGVRGEALASMFLFASVTNPPSSPVIAGNLGGSQEIATQCMVMNLTVSVFTSLIGLSILRSMAWI
jgi:predicted permease